MSQERLGLGKHVRWHPFRLGGLGPLEQSQKEAVGFHSKNLVCSFLRFQRDVNIIYTNRSLEA